MCSGNFAPYFVRTLRKRINPRARLRYGNPEIFRDPFCPGNVVSECISRTEAFDLFESALVSVQQYLIVIRSLHIGPLRIGAGEQPLVGA